MMLYHHVHLHHTMYAESESKLFLGDLNLGLTLSVHTDLKWCNTHSIEQQWSPGTKIQKDWRVCLYWIWSYFPTVL